MDSAQCPTCSASAQIVINDGRDFFLGVHPEKLFQLAWCSSCSIGFSLPKMSHFELSPFYPRDFEAFQPKKGFLNWIQRVKYGQDVKIVKRLTGGLKYQPSVLEIGAGRGEFLAFLKKNGFIVSGIEPGEAGRTFAKEYFGIELLDGNGDSVNFLEKYDVIILRHVLEHLNDPYSCLKTIFSEGLKEGGSILLKVPKLNSWEYRLFGKYWDGLDLPRHRFHFTDKGLLRMIKEIGFSKVTSKQERVGSSLVRSISYFSDDRNSWLSLPGRLFKLFPGSIQLALCQVLVTLFFFLPADRMIVTARK